MNTFYTIGWGSLCFATKINCTSFLKAERGGFEPPIAFQLYRFSRPTHSAALPPLRIFHLLNPKNTMNVVCFN